MHKLSQYSEHGPHNTVCIAVMHFQLMLSKVCAFYTQGTSFHIKKPYLSRIKERVIVTNVEAVSLASWAPIASVFYFSVDGEN